MSLELGTQSYNRLPEASYRDSRYIDISHWIQGARTREVLGKNPGSSRAKNTFTTKPGSIGDNSVAILLPGTLVPSATIFQEQIPVIEETGSKPVLVDYSNERFSQEMLRAQIADLLSSPLAQNADVNLIGFSLGAANVLDLLVHEPEAAERINKVILMGVLFSSHDLKDDPLYQVARALRRYGVLNDTTIRAFMPLVRNRIKVNHDPLLGAHEGAIRDSIRDVKNRALSERASSILTRVQIESHGNIADIPALLIHWENDKSTVRRQEVIAQSFSRADPRKVSGNHGWTLTSAAEINPQIAGFLTLSEEEVRVAV